MTSLSCLVYLLPSASRAHTPKSSCSSRRSSGLIPRLDFLFIAPGRVADCECRLPSMRTAFVGDTRYGRVSITRTSSPNLACSSPPSPYVFLLGYSRCSDYDHQGDWSERIETMTDAEVQAELMDVLHAMYPNMTEIPEPTSILFHRWYNDPLARGSYSNWPAGFFQEHHDNLRATVDERLWFTGEHCSQKYFVRALPFFALFLLKLFLAPGGRVSCTAHGSKDETQVKSWRNVSTAAGVFKSASTLRM